MQYIYEHALNGKIREETQTIAEMEKNCLNPDQPVGKRLYMFDGGTWRRRVDLEVSGSKHSYGKTWPMKSDAAGVHPDQIGTAYEDSVRAGVPTQFTKDGRAIFESAKHRKKYCEATRIFDKNAGYGDPQPR